MVILKQRKPSRVRIIGRPRYHKTIKHNFLSAAIARHQTNPGETERAQKQNMEMTSPLDEDKKNKLVKTVARANYSIYFLLTFIACQSHSLTYYTSNSSCPIKKLRLYHVSMRFIVKSLFIVVFDAAGDSSQIARIIRFTKPTRCYTQLNKVGSISSLWVIFDE
jgi:hypothetical protein